VFSEKRYASHTSGNTREDFKGNVALCRIKPFLRYNSAMPLCRGVD